MKMLAFRFIFYSIITLGLFLLGYWLAPEMSQEFLQNWKLWQEPLLAGMIGGLGIALLGVYILLNRVVFLSLAIAQGSGLGIYFVFWVGSFWAWHVDESLWVFSGGLFFAMLAAALFALLRRRESFSESSLLGLIYVISSGAMILLGDRITQASHDIEHLLFGSVVAVHPKDLYFTIAITGLILVSHIFFRRQFLYASADPTFLKSRGMNTSFCLLLLYALFTLGITSGLKIMGALPIFAMIVMPAFIAIKRARSIQETFIIAMWMGAFIPVLGYYYSYLFAFPTGACLILIATLFLLLSILESEIRKVFLKK